MTQFPFFTHRFLLTSARKSLVDTPVDDATDADSSKVDALRKTKQTRNLKKQAINRQEIDKKNRQEIKKQVTLNRQETVKILDSRNRQEIKKSRNRQ